MPLGNPAPPELDGSDLDARGATFLNLKWNSVVDAVIYVVQCGGESKSFSVPTVPFQTTFSLLPSNTKYTLSLRVIDGAGNVMDSAPTDVYTRPERPSFLKMASPAEQSRRDRSVFIDWENVAGIDLYEVERDKIEVRITDSPPAAGFEFIALTPNVTYTFCVRSRVETPAGRVAVSYDSDLLAVLTRPPTPGSIRVLGQAGQQIRIEWGAIASFHDSALAKLEIGRSETSDPADNIRTTVPSLASSSFVDHFDSQPTTLEYGVRVTVSANKSFWSSALFRPTIASSVTGSDVSQTRTHVQQTFVISVLRGANE